MSQRSILLGVSIAMWIGGCGRQGIQAGSNLGERCRAKPDTIQVIDEDPTAFTPYEQQRSHVFPTMFELDGTALVAFPARLENTPLLGQATSGPSTMLIYSVNTIPELSYVTILESGGLLLESTKIPEGESPLADLPDFVAARATMVDVSTIADGYISWDDPIDEEGHRPHRVVWVQDGTLFTLIADRSAVDLIDIARQTSCLMGAPV